MATKTLTNSKTGNKSTIRFGKTGFAVTRNNGGAPKPISNQQGARAVKALRQRNTSRSARSGRSVLGGVTRGIGFRSGTTRQAAAGGSKG